jgi:hypothetical protein
MSIDPPDRDADPFAPPKIPTEVCCLHCGAEYDSYLIEWRVETKADGSQEGFWCCATPGCGGVGFGFDLLPTDPTYQDEHGRWAYDEDDEDDCDVESNGFSENPEQPPEIGDEEIPF